MADHHQEQKQRLGASAFQGTESSSSSYGASMAWAVEIIGSDGLVIRCREALPLHDVFWLLRGR
jgi:hypothetical protein